jgi:hypothetical protein
MLPIFLLSDVLNIDYYVPEFNSRLELPVLMSPGEPMVPYIPLKILLPMGEEFERIEIDYTADTKISKDVEPDIAVEQIPLSVYPKLDMTATNPTKQYPTSEFEVLGVQRKNGYDVLLVNAFPYRYNTVSKELITHRNFKLEVHTKYNSAMMETQSKLLVESKHPLKVLNPQALTSYLKTITHSSRDFPESDEPYSMIIITDEARYDFFDEFVVWKQEQGITAKVFLTSDIYGVYAGTDDADKIRNFILDAYMVYSATQTPLEYVILGGDDEIIPIRGVYGQVGSYHDFNMPCDLYYSCLDGNWNADGDDVFGEIIVSDSGYYNVDDVDMLPEIAIGRIPAETEAEFNNFFEKNYHYTDVGAVGNDVAYFVGENLNWDPVTWGGDYCDEIIPLTNQDFHMSTLYDRDGTYSPNNVRSAINEGTAILNHMGHSNETMVFGQSSSMVNSYTNNEYGFAYSQGCYPAAFDESTSSTGESIAENLVKSEHGLYAFVGNTRYGWYMPGSTNGASQFYNISFFEALFPQNIRELGNALNYSREVLINEALNSDVMRWVYFEMVLFGDPSVQVKDPIGNFPYIVPGEVTYDDEMGDGDGTPNPGEQINITAELQNLPEWEDAYDVYAKINFTDDSIEVLQDSVYYGNISSGGSATGTSFSVMVPQDCNYDVYEFELAVYSPVSRDPLFHRNYDLQFRVSLFQQYWPWISDSGIVSNPVICDINEDDEREIFVTDAYGQMNALDSAANPLPDFPWEQDVTLFKSTAYADIDNDDDKEIILADRGGKIIALESTGEVIFEYLCEEQLFTPVISDITGDGVPEIISFGSDNKVVVLNSAGEDIPVYPIELSSFSLSEIASADLDDDGKNEIVIGTLDGLVYALNYAGENLPGFPVELNSPVYTAPIILDNLNIAIGTVNNKLFVIDSLGQVITEKQLTSRIVSSPIAADFDNDDELEIAVSCLNGAFYITEQDGTDLAGWPVLTGMNITNPPLAADIDNDNDVEFLCFTAMNELFVFNPDGSEVEFSPVPMNMSGNTPASIDDIDIDGDFDVVAGTSESVFVIDIKLPKGDKLPWRTYRGNYKRTGFYGDNILADAGGEEVPVTNNVLLQNFPNPFNPTTTISFELNNEQNEQVRIEIYNIKGRLVDSIPIHSSTLSPCNSVTWNADRFASGVYFYKLVADGKDVASKKMLLLK